MPECLLPKLNEYVLDDPASRAVAGMFPQRTCFVAASLHVQDLVV